MKAPSFVWFMGIAAIFGVFSSCALFSHQPASHISVKAVSWLLVKKYAEPDAGLVGYKITIVDPADGRVVAEKSTDDLGYAIFDVPAGSYTITGIGVEPQNVAVSPGQTVGFKLIVH
ncbi:MAG: carboxypeptidase regulatory-like domain-containing protein [Deltaproteobacteria bacterium]|nr:carboxypeptidase regulatory-like domain-containing protein [Deltaproteobacteria bacterium]